LRYLKNKLNFVAFTGATTKPLPESTNSVIGKLRADGFNQVLFHMSRPFMEGQFRPAPGGISLTDSPLQPARETFRVSELQALRIWNNSDPKRNVGLWTPVAFSGTTATSTRPRKPSMESQALEADQFLRRVPSGQRYAGLRMESDGEAWSAR